MSSALVPSQSSELSSILSSELEPEFDPELELELELEPSSSSGSEREPELRIELNSEVQAGARNRSGTRARTRARTQLRQEPELGIELLGSGFNYKPSSGSERELNSELSRPVPTRAQARVLAQLQSEPEFRAELESSRLQATPDPVIERAVAATQRARVSMIRKYTKKHDIQHFEVGAIVSIKVPREDRTSTDNKRLFARILEEPYPYRYRILTALGIIQRLIPTKSLRAVEQDL
ncbi:hypothetical protein V498_01230 [Pseudogymnoascus sp. VKM F-4517 (FW-2822)]|nr:hypothetical protein V498_01230 [Pseudogymnoascus sp. VKM F-4517 (FW-2822)]